jgi:hypothetical protein
MAYVKRNKSDAADAEAVCEAVRRPTMRFARNKSAEQLGDGDERLPIDSADVAVPPVLNQSSTTAR